MAVEAQETSPTIIEACKVLDEIKALLIEKNKAYGDSAGRPMRVFSRASVVEQLYVRIDDKLSRVARGGGIDAMGEDVVKDLLGYFAILQAVRRLNPIHSASSGSDFSDFPTPSGTGNSEKSENRMQNGSDLAGRLTAGTGGGR